MADRYEKLDFADRWMADSLQVFDAPGFFCTIDVDMTSARAVIAQLRAAGIDGTYTHVFVRAVALTLARHPEIHQMVSGRRRLLPGRVDIGLSVRGQTFVSPVLILEDAGSKNLQVLAQEIIKRAPEVREKEVQTLAGLRKWGWILPLSGIRRSLMRMLQAQIPLRRQSIGTFQVTCLSGVDVVVPLKFATAGIVGVGRVRDQVIAVDGQPVVRPVVTVSCCVDHKVWDGARATLFLTTLGAILTSGELSNEIPG